jgi:hypothetical protein
MKKTIILTLLVFQVLITPRVIAQTVIQSDFVSDIIPSYMASGSSTRLAVVIRATVQNLNPNSLYRYFNQGAIFSDIGSTNPGAGNPLLINIDSVNYHYTTSPSLTTAGNYGVFRTNSSGQYTGWFGFVNTGNARFTAGNHIIPTIVIGDSTGVLVSRRALDDSILVLAFGNTIAPTQGTGIFGRSSGIPKNIVCLYDNLNGTGKPVSITYLENDGTTISSSVTFYTDSVNGVDGRWGTIIPNQNSNGIRRVEERFLANGEIKAFGTSATGLWPSGANTVDPTGGTTPIILDYIDAPLPVELISFSATLVDNEVLIRWSTATESNNSGFEVQRKHQNDFQSIGFVRGNGTSVDVRHYQFTDHNLIQGNLTYRLEQIDFDGTEKYSNEIAVYIKALETFNLQQNFPNPFNPSTLINYQIPSNSFVKIKVYDPLGKEICTLVNEQKDAGSYSVNFSAQELSSGVYFYTLQAGDFVSIKKMILIK